MNKIFLSILIVLLPVTLMAAAMLPGDAANGKKVHDNNCLNCHAQIDDQDPDMLYLDEDRRISDIGSLMNQVSSCNSYQETGLSEDEIDDVVKYLNESFYEFDD